MFPFLELPPELRNKIYKLLLVSDTPPVRVHGFYWTFRENGIEKYGKLKTAGPCNINPCILCTCRKINNEATHYLYGSNAFCFPIDETDRGWLLKIGPTNARMVKNITTFDRTLYFDYPYFEDFNHLFRRGKGLRRLRIYVVGLFAPPDYIQSFLLRIKTCLVAHETLRWLVIPRNFMRYMIEGTMFILFLATLEDAETTLEQYHVFHINRDINNSALGGEFLLHDSSGKLAERLAAPLSGWPYSGPA
ncbi:MAG: hypothetical protein Q9221_006056 [Calogaya cf. arnoldii]